MKWSPLATLGVVLVIGLVTLDYLLVQLSFSGWLRLPAVLATLVTTERTWAASELPHEAVVVTPSGGVTPQVADQFFLFGPYEPVVAGEYELLLEGSATQGGTVLVGEAVGGQGAERYDQFHLTGSQLPVRRPLRLPNVAELELRFRTPTAGAVTIERVRLIRRRIDWPQAVLGVARSVVRLVRHDLFSLEFY